MTTTVEPYTLAREEGQPIWFLGTLMILKATGENTNGAYGLIEQTLPPGFAPPLHVHHREDEAFYLLEGAATFTCGNQTMKAVPGSYVFFPRDIPHWFHVEGNQPARLLQFNFPAGLEHFFVEMGEPAQKLTLPPAGPPDIGKLAETAARYGMEILGPPPV
ncbi:MAG: quercetin 2,3-dioxygenase [Anaerolineae bacterium]|nr:quercetin 2,3-dioxygenase [Anaerolineae bacterium]